MATIRSRCGAASNKVDGQLPSSQREPDLSPNVLADLVLDTERLRYSSRLQLSQPRCLAVKLCALARRLGTEKLELLLKEHTVGRTPPHLRLDTHPRLGHGLVYPTLFGSARRALCSKGSDVVRRVAAGVTPTAGESVRGRRCFTIRGVDQAGNHCITQFLVERTNESRGVSRQRYHFES